MLAKLVSVPCIVKNNERCKFLCRISKNIRLYTYTYIKKWRRICTFFLFAHHALFEKRQNMIAKIYGAWQIISDETRCSFRAVRDKNDRLVRISRNQKFVRARVSRRECRDCCCSQGTMSIPTLRVVVAYIRRSDSSSPHCFVKWNFYLI